jgi:RNA ligase (TIGR02306 family)
MKLASIEVIKNLKNHPNADSLEIGEILGWQVVVKKGIHKEGDKVVFVTIDTIVPRRPWSEFLADKENPEKPIRLKNIKLRGEYSSGLVIPLSEFEPKNSEEIGYDLTSCEVGYDLTSALGIEKYVKELPANLSGDNEGDFPSHLISKTDEHNGLNDPNLAEEVFNSSEDIVITSKIDGSSITIVVEDGAISKVCSRNLSKKDAPNSTFWNAAKKLTLPEKWSGVIQAEMAGNGIQKNRLKLNDVRLFVFQIYSSGKYMDYSEMRDFCEKELKCDCVPLVAKIKVSETVKLWENPLKKLQELADNQKYPSGLDAEGIVVRPSPYRRSKTSRRPMGFKLINRNYKD